MMPWKECSVTDERMQFVARRLAGEPMAELCRKFGVSRKTGYKIFDRYQECGVQGLTDRSRRPYRYANQLPFQVENYILNVKHGEALSSTREDCAFLVFERLFKERGLPANIRSDNGVPFASAHALFNLSKLAVWWLRLGIGIERIRPGSPQQNGRHERMHLTLKKEATKPAAVNFLQQQARFDKFSDIFNHERPHEALGMKCPAEVYQPSPRLYKGLPDIDYPFHGKTIVVTRCGRICMGRKKINFSQVFTGQAVGIKEVHDDIWLVRFMDYDLGYFDLETRVLEPLENLFGPKVLPM
jgi:putative transposase